MPRVAPRHDEHYRLFVRTPTLGAASRKNVSSIESTRVGADDLADSSAIRARLRTTGNDVRVALWSPPSGGPHVTTEASHGVLLALDALHARIRRARREPRHGRLPR